MQDRPIRNYFLHVVLCLREYEEDIGDATFAQLSHFTLLIENSAQDERQRVEDGISR